jgi:hypothetical protein
MHGWIQVDQTNSIFKLLLRNLEAIVFFWTGCGLVDASWIEKGGGTM